MTNPVFFTRTYLSFISPIAWYVKHILEKLLIHQGGSHAKNLKSFSSQKMRNFCQNFILIECFKAAGLN